MRVQHGVIARTVKAVIIPVNQRRIPGQLFSHRRIDGAVRPVVFPARGQPEEHIAPQHRPEAVPVRQTMYPLKMSQEQLRAVSEAVLLQVFSKPQHMRLVHADIDLFRAEAPAHFREDRLDQPPGLLFVQQQNIVNVHIIPHGVPFEGLLQVRQRLHGGNQLDPQRRGVIVQRRQLRVRVALPPVAEIGIVLQDENILHIQLQRTVPHPRQDAQQPLHALHARHGVAGAVQHSAEAFKRGRLAQGEACFFGAVRPNQPHRPSRHPRLFQLRQPAGILFYQYNAAIPRQKADILHRAKLPRDPVDVQRFLHAFPFLSVRKGGNACALPPAVAAFGDRWQRLNSPSRQPFR